jgi:hypothetical protein
MDSNSDTPIIGRQLQCLLDDLVEKTNDFVTEGGDPRIVSVAIRSLSLRVHSTLGLFSSNINYGGYLEIIDAMHESCLTLEGTGIPEKEAIFYAQETASYNSDILPKLTNWYMRAA